LFDLYTDIDTVFPDSIINLSGRLIVWPIILTVVVYCTSGERQILRKEQTFIIILVSCNNKNTFSNLPLIIKFLPLSMAAPCKTKLDEEPINANDIKNLIEQSNCTNKGHVNRCLPETG